MDQAGILRKFIQGVKAMSEGDEERGEDNFGSDFMVGQNLHASFALHLSQPDLSPFIISTFSSVPTLHTPPPPSRLLVPCIPQEVRQGRPHCPLPFPPVSRLYMAA